MSNRSHRTFREGRRELLTSIVMLLALAVSGPAGAQNQGRPLVGEPVTPDVLDIDLRSLVQVRVQAWTEGEPVRIIEDLKEEEAPPALPMAAEAGSPEGTAPSAATRMRALAPAAIVSFPGIPATGFLPPDTVGD